MKRSADIALFVLFAVSPLAMFALSGKYAEVYLIGTVATAGFAAARIRIAVQSSGLFLLLFFTATSQLTLPLLVAAVCVVCVYLYGGSLYSPAVRPDAGPAFSETKRAGRHFQFSAEAVRVGVSALVISVITSIFSSAVGIRANGLLIFIFLISAGLLVLAFLSTYLAEH